MQGQALEILCILVIPYQTMEQQLMCASHLTLLLCVSPPRPHPQRKCVFVLLECSPAELLGFMLIMSSSCIKKSLISRRITVRSLRNNKTPQRLCIMQQRDEKALNVTSERCQKDSINWCGNTEEGCKPRLLCMHEERSFTQNNRLDSSGYITDKMSRLMHGCPY